MSKKVRKNKVITPHEFRTFKARDLYNKPVMQIRHYNHGEYEDTLPIDLPNEIQARQICAVLNKVFKLGIGWGYNYAKYEALPKDEESTFLLKEEDVIFKVDLQNIEQEGIS